MLKISVKDVPNFSRTQLSSPSSVQLFLGAWGQSLSKLQRVSTGTNHSCWCKGPGGVRHRSVSRSHSRTSGHFKMFGCLFTGTLVLSCIDRTPQTGLLIGLSGESCSTCWQGYWSWHWGLFLKAGPRVLQRKNKNQWNVHRGQAACPSSAEL